MKTLVTAVLCLAILFGSMELPRPQPARAQASLIMLGLVAAMAVGVGGVLIWAYSKNSSQIDIRWVVFMSGSPGSHWSNIATQKCILGPGSELKAFPALYLFNTNNQCWIKARLAEDWEIPQTPQQASGAWGYGFSYTKEQLAMALTQ